MRTKNGENLMIFHAFIGTQSQSKNLGTSRTEFWWFLLKPLSLLSGTPSTVYLTACVTCRVDSSTHSGYMYKPSWGPINREKVQNFFHWNGFVTTPVTFNFNFPKNRDFDDLGKAMMNILNLMCSNGPGWWVGAQGCLEHGLESSRSNLRSETI